MGVAIAWFTTHNYTVCIPITDSQPYDLVVDDGTGIQRVSVKTTTKASGEVGLRTQGGNKSQFKIKHFDKSEAELLFVATPKNMLLIPTKLITCKTSIKAYCDKYKDFEVHFVADG